MYVCRRRNTEMLNLPALLAGRWRRFPARMSSGAEGSSERRSMSEALIMAK